VQQASLTLKNRFENAKSGKNLFAARLTFRVRLMFVGNDRLAGTRRRFVFSSRQTRAAVYARSLCHSLSFTRPDE